MKNYQKNNYIDTSTIDDRIVKYVQKISSMRVKEVKMFMTTSMLSISIPLYYQVILKDYSQSFFGKYIQDIIHIFLILHLINIMIHNVLFRNIAQNSLDDYRLDRKYKKDIYEDLVLTVTILDRLKKYVCSFHNTCALLFIISFVDILSIIIIYNNTLDEVYNTLFELYNTSKCRIKDFWPDAI